MVRRNRAEFLTSNLPQLQNYIKRDPQSYTGEFMQQWRHYESIHELFKLKPDVENKDFASLINFISHVCQCYPDVTKDFSSQIVNILEDNYATISPELRMTMVNALVLLRNRNIVSTMSMISLFFKLFKCKDKNLRAQLHTYIVTDVKNLNAKSKNNKVNKVLQNFMYTMLKDSNETAAKKSLEVMIELYRKGIWNDTKTVNVIAEACFSPTPKLVAPALHFFLGTNDDTDIDSEDEAEDPNSVLESVRHGMHVGGKKKSSKNAVKKALANMKKKERSKVKESTATFTALQLINDPQGFSDRLFSRLRATTSNNAFKFEMRLLLMNVLTRIIGVHKLMVLGLYDFMIVYLKSQQREVTSILAYAAQASHNLVPPEYISPMVQAIADNFVWNNVSSEVVTAGLNGLREICSRCPLAMSETLLQSLLDDYKNYREKGPMMAARGLLALYREINPEMLRKRDRGKNATMALKDGKVKGVKYGQFYDNESSAIDLLKTIENESINKEELSEQEGETLEQVKGWSDFEEASSDEELEGELEEVLSGEEEECDDLDSELEKELEEVIDSVNIDEKEELIEEENAELNSDLEKELEEVIASVDADEEIENVDKDVEEEEEDEEDTPQVSEEQLRRAKEAEKADKAYNDFSKIAQTKILTNEDFKLLNKLQSARDAAQQLAKQPVKRKMKIRKVGNVEAAQQLLEEEAAENLSAAVEYERKIARTLLKRSKIDDEEAGEESERKTKRSRASPEDSELLSDEEEEEEEEADNGIVDVTRIMRGIRSKNDYEARMDSIKAGREGRQYGSRKGSDERVSKTNKQKEKTTKNFMMIAHKRSVRGKAKRSLKEKRRVLRNHIDLQKKKKH